MDAPAIVDPPQNLTKEETIKILKKVNSTSIIELKSRFDSYIKANPQAIPLLLETIATDLVKKDYNYTEDEYKSACSKF